MIAHHWVGLEPVPLGTQAPASWLAYGGSRVTAPTPYLSCL